MSWDTRSGFIELLDSQLSPLPPANFYFLSRLKIASHPIPDFHETGQAFQAEYPAGDPENGVEGSGPPPDFDSEPDKDNKPWPEQP